MRLLDQITISSHGRAHSIELCQGDLTDIPGEQATDLLVVSAFPKSYQPFPSTLIGALHRKGISVAQLAEAPAVDLRAAFSCWLSRAIDPQPGLPYHRILCFEPPLGGHPPFLVGGIFRALAPFLQGPPPVESVAMPLVAAGMQRYGVEAMLAPLLDAAVNWLKAGMPLSVLKVVVYSEEQVPVARDVFARVKQAAGVMSDARAGFVYDVFVSYAHEDRRPAQVLVDQLRELSLRVFMDRFELKEGLAWQPHIFSAIDQCQKLLAIYSPAYLGSKVCLEEFNIAWARGRQEERDTIFPVYWRSTDLPTYMNMLVYADCREEREEKLGEACVKLQSLCDR